MKMKMKTIFGCFMTQMKTSCRVKQTVNWNFKIGVENLRYEQMIAFSARVVSIFDQAMSDRDANWREYTRESCGGGSTSPGRRPDVCEAPSDALGVLN